METSNNENKPIEANNDANTTPRQGGGYGNDLWGDVQYGDTNAKIEPIIKKLEKLTDKPQGTLFSNAIDPERAFGISRGFGDNLKGLIDEITPATVERGFKYDKTTFSTKEGKLALRVIDEKQQIQTAEQLYNALAKIKSGKVLQTLLALWYYSNKQGGFVFSGTRLSKIMQEVLKNKSGYFTQPQKRDFTEAIHRLRDFEISLDQDVPATDDHGNKKRGGQMVVKRNFHRLIDLVGATYAKRKQDLIDPETGTVIAKKGEADESVIIRLYGELLPRFNKGIMRGRLYNRGLLELDANKDERAILLGFSLLTRFDQMRMGKTGKDLVGDNKLFIKVDRKNLIEWANYKQTDEVNKSVANQHLVKTLNKLIEINCLRDYQPRELTTNDDLKIFLYPSPIALKPPINGDVKLENLKNKSILDEEEKDKPADTEQGGQNETG